MIQQGGRRCRTDPTIWTFSRPGPDGVPEVYCIIAAYVDDFLICGLPCPETEDIKKAMKERFRWGSWKSRVFDLCGVRISQSEDYSIEIDQAKYVFSSIDTINVNTSENLDREVTPQEQSMLRAVWGALQWKVTQTGPQFASSLSELQARVKDATLKLVKDTNNLVHFVKANECSIKIHCLDRNLSWDEIAVIAYSDAAQGDRPDGGSTGGYLLCFGGYKSFLSGAWTDLSLIGWSTNRLKRVARSSLAAEIQQIVNTDDEVYVARLLWSELHGVIPERSDVVSAVVRTPGIEVIDAKGVFDALANSSSTAMGLTEKRSGIELQGLRDSVDECNTDMRWCHSDIQLADGMTKSKMRERVISFLKRPRWRLVLDQTYTSATKRKKMGLAPLDDMPTPTQGDTASAEFLMCVIDKFLLTVDGAMKKPFPRLHDTRQRGTMFECEHYDIGSNCED